MYYVLLIILCGCVVYYEYDQNNQLQLKVADLQSQVSQYQQSAQDSVNRAQQIQKKLDAVMARPQISLPAPVQAPVVIQEPPPAPTPTPTEASHHVSMDGLINGK